MVRMSFTIGTFSRINSSAVSNDAAIAGSAEFFAPLMRTLSAEAPGLQ